MEIKRAEFVMSNTRLDKCPADGKKEYAFIGRSNVGKSSLINMLTQKPKLAMTSQTPGKTLLINHFVINDEWYLVDLPGYGYAKRGKVQQQKISELIARYILHRTELTCLFLLIDIRLEPQAIDLEFIRWLGMNGIPFAMVFTKADKLSVGKVRSNVNSYLERLSQEWEELPKHFVTSSTTKLGRTELLAYIHEINHMV